MGIQTLAEANRVAKSYGFVVRIWHGKIQMKRFGKHICWPDFFNPYPSYDAALTEAQREFHAIQQGREARRMAASQPES
jgi:hypothetical protein